MTHPPQRTKPVWSRILDRPGARCVIRSVNWLGDAVMSLPAIQRLAEAHPALHITVLAPAKIAPIFEAFPQATEVVPIESGAGLLAVSRRMRAVKADVAVLFPNSLRTGLEAWLAGVPHRVGRARNGRQLLLTVPVGPRLGERPMRKPTVAEIRGVNDPAAPRGTRTQFGPEVHHVHNYLHIVAAAGADPTPCAPALRVSAGSVEEVARALGLAPARPWIGLAPGAEYGPAKRWPWERFVEVGSSLAKRTGGCCLVLGGPGDVAIGRQVVDGIRSGTGDAAAAELLAGRTSLGQLMGVMAGSRVVVGNDSGAMHLARALGTPVVAVFGSTAPEFTSPGLPGDPEVARGLLVGEAPCAPCFSRDCPVGYGCLLSVDAARVVGVADALMRRG